MEIENSKMIYRGSNELARVYRGETVVWEPYQHPYMDEYLTFEVVGSSAGTFNFEYWPGLALDIEFSKNDGGWIHYASASTADRTVRYGDKVRIKGMNASYSYTDGAIHTSRMWIDGTEYIIYGNIMSLVYGDSFIWKRRLTVDYCFANLFSAFTDPNNNCSDASNLCLPATGLTGACYMGLLRGTDITTAPELPSKVLSNGCYLTLFDGCENLSAAPELPATSLTLQCYASMFRGCVSLAAAPDLPAEYVPMIAYVSMFDGCENLQYVKCMATSFEDSDCTYNWLRGVAASGTFVKNSTMASWSSGKSGIPQGWTVVNG